MPKPAKKKNSRLIVTLIFLAILSLSLFLRVWRLDSLPPGLYPDEAMNANNALETIKTGNFKVFYPENNGREGLFMWLISLSFLLFGKTIWALRIVSATIGTLTVGATYFLSRELMISSDSGKDSQKNAAVPLLAAFFLAVSFWHINFSRISFRAILMPLVLSLAFWIFFAGFRKKRRVLLILSGVFFGMGFYTYISYRFTVLIVLLVWIIWLKSIKETELRKEFLKLSAFGFLAAFVVALPIGIYFLSHPEDFIGRAAGVSIFSEERPLYEAGKSLILHLGMFNFHGDANWRHNLSGEPQLLWPVGIFFLVGIAFSISKMFSKRKKPIQIAARALLPVWFFVMLLPGLLSAEGAPHALRVLAIIPAVFIMAGTGAWLVFSCFGSKFWARKELFLFYPALIIFILSIAFAEFDKYFYRWGKSPDAEDAFSKNYLTLGRYLNSLDSDIDKYVIVNQAGTRVPWPDGIPVSAQTTMFIEQAENRGEKSAYILPEQLRDVRIYKRTVFAPLQKDENLLKELIATFPEGKLKEFQNIWIYEI